jgi:hypothetical protein
MSQADGSADHCSDRVMVGGYDLPTLYGGRPVLHPQDAQARGTSLVWLTLYVIAIIVVILTN